MTQATFDKVEKVWGPPPAYREALRKACVAEVLDQWKKPENRKPIHIGKLWKDVSKRVETLVQEGAWDCPGWFPGELSIRRRINGCQDPRHWEDGPAPLVLVGKEGFYSPNPKRFPELYLEGEGVGQPR